MMSINIKSFIRKIYRKTSYNDLYITILKIGKDRMEDGISINQLKKELILRGFDLSNDCTERATLHCFLCNFVHYDRNEHKLDGDVDLSNIDGHENCNFILRSDSCLAIIEHETSVRNIKIAMTALFVAILSIIV